MTRRSQGATPLSQVDAFFVAYQQEGGILMQVGAEAEIEGSLQKQDIEQMLVYVITRWPQLGQRLKRRAFGLAWQGKTSIDGMLRIEGDVNALARWFNEPIDPFTQPPFQVLWVAMHDVHYLSFRGHHAAADGEAFFFSVKEALRALASVLGGGVAAPAPARFVALKEAISTTGPVRASDLRVFWDYLRWLKVESLSGNSANLWKHECCPGDVAQCERVIQGDLLSRFHETAREKGVLPMWLAAAAWILALHKWNVLHHNGYPTTISLEVPVSLKRDHLREGSLGNLISPLILYGDPSRTVKDIASSLKQQLFSGLRNRLHIAVPYCTRMGSMLPWPIFKRLAVRTSSTGFATSHFTWLPQEEEFLTDIVQFSRGAMRIVRQGLCTPVCLHMGATLSVLVLQEKIKFFINYRKTALNVEDANKLADLLINAAIPTRAACEEILM